MNPELDWSGVPAGTKSFAMTFIDTTLGEDSQFGQHWAIWNVPWDPATGKVTMFPEALPMTLTGRFRERQAEWEVPDTLRAVGDEQHGRPVRVHSLRALDPDPGITGTSVANALTALRAATATTLGKVVLKGHAGLKGK